MIRICFVLLFISVNTINAQSIFVQGAISRGVNIVSIKDDDGRTSGEYYPADGLTQVEGQQQVSGLQVSATYSLKEQYSLKSGLWFTKKLFYVRNTDGGYTGVSKYSLSYLQLPILLHLDAKEVHKNILITCELGPVIELKAKEKLVINAKKGLGDGAHFWNFAKNYTTADPTRGMNGNGKAMALFGPFDLGAYINVGARINLAENIDMTGAISFQKSFSNVLNSKLVFKAPYNDISITEDLSIKSALIALEVGIRYKLQ